MFLSLKLLFYLILFDLLFHRFLSSPLLLFTHELYFFPSFFFFSSLLILHLLLQLFFHAYLVVLQSLFCLFLLPVELIHIEHDDFVPVVFILHHWYISWVVCSTTTRSKDLVACLLNDWWSWSLRLCMWDIRSSRLFARDNTHRLG